MLAEKINPQITQITPNKPLGDKEAQKAQNGKLVIAVSF
jgi:hypothetical protein